MTAESTESPTDEWQDILDDAEDSTALLQALEQEILQLSQPRQLSLFDVSLNLGTGYTDNYLRRNQAIASRFSQFEAELFAANVGNRLEWQAFIYAEGSIYHEPEQPVSEGLLIGQANVSLSLGEHWSVGQTAQIYLADLIYDASLFIEGQPQQERLRQIRPEYRLSLRRQIAAKHQLSLEAAVRRNQYADSANDAWRAMADLKWTFAASAKLEFSATLQGWEDAYDERISRLANGIATDDGTLRVRGVGLRLDTRWQTPLEPLSLSTNLFAGRESEPGNGLYEANDQLRANLRARWKSGPLQLEAVAGWQRRSYDARAVSIVDPTAQQQDFAFAQLKFSWRWTEGLTTGAEFMWEDFDSRVADDIYRQKRTRVYFQLNF